MINKFAKLGILLLTLVLCCMCFFACNDNGDTNKDPSAGNPPAANPPALSDITGVTFESKTVDFNGATHTLTITGTLPTGVSVTYTNNSGTNVGTYEATAVLSGEGYNTLTLTATLTINAPQLPNITGVTFTGDTVTYDGNSHAIMVAGTLPQGAEIVYTNNVGTNAGTYQATAVISAPGYNTLTLTATLTINPTPIENITFTGKSFEFDGNPHTITITGLTPPDATITYTGGEDNRNGATNPGSYTVTVTVSCPNYSTFTATATLTITSKEEPLTLAFVGGKIFFQNPLHKNYLYTVNGSAVERVSRDTPTAMVTVGQKIYYLSKGLLSSGVYSFDPATGKTSCLLEVSAELLITDGTNLYYNVNSLLKSEQNGIYRISIADLENDRIDPTPVRLTAAKCGSFTLVGGIIYFSNKNDDGKLYAISTSATNGTPTKIYDYTVEELISDTTNGTIYFVRNKLMGDAIYSIDVSGNLCSPITDESNKLTKIAASKGKCLTLVGNYIYLINTDLATATIVGDGYEKQIKSGDYFYLPFVAEGKFKIKSETSATIIECLPSKQD